MKKIIMGSASVVALLAAAPALAQSNTSDVDQDGSDNIAVVDQTGSGGNSEVDQLGTSNDADVEHHVGNHARTADRDRASPAPYLEIPQRLVIDVGRDQRIDR